MLNLNKKTLTKLQKAAQRVAMRSYSPYSHFPVGAAILTQSGAIYTGTNVENASYGLTICAERGAMMQAVASGDRKPVAMALYTNTKHPSSPCGACRQFLAEFNIDMEVYCFSNQGDVHKSTLNELLPQNFKIETAE